VARFLLVRHASAESDDADAPLTPRGVVEAHALAHRLAGRGFDAVWCSDMARAIQTAETILSHSDGQPPLQSPLLREVDHPPSLLSLMADPAGYSAGDCRAAAEVAERLRKWLRVARAAGIEGDSNPTILVVSHGGPLRVLICLLLGLSPEAHWSFRVDHGSISELERGDDMGTLLRLNDCCHLEEDVHHEDTKTPTRTGTNKIDRISRIDRTIRGRLSP